MVKGVAAYDKGVDTFICTILQSYAVAWKNHNSFVRDDNATLRTRICLWGSLGLFVLCRLCSTNLIERGRMPVENLH